MASLDKVYADKGVSAELDDPRHGMFAGDEGDLYELLGCLLDNAYKWCERQVLLGVADGAAGGVTLTVDANQTLHGEGEIDLDLVNDPIGTNDKGEKVYLKDVWPTHYQLEPGAQRIFHYTP